MDASIIHKSGLMSGGNDSRPKTKHWNDKEAENLILLQAKLMKDLEDLDKQRKWNENEGNLVSDLQVGESRLKHLAEELSAITRSLDGKQEQLNSLKEKVELQTPIYHKAKDTLAGLENETKLLQDANEKAEDRIFESFCKKLKIKSIRSYKSESLTQKKDAIEKLLNFSENLSKVQNELEFERSRLAEIDSRISKLEGSIERDEETLQKYQIDLEEAEKANDRFAAEVQLLNEKLQDLKKSKSLQSDAVSKIKEQLDKANKEINSLSRSKAEYETVFDKAINERFALIRRCKLEEINIPLKNNSLDKISLDQLGVQQDESMDDDVERRDYDLRMDGIEIDYSSLTSQYRGGRREKAMEELDERIENLGVELEQMVPNMKAVDRIEGVENRLQITDKECQDARKTLKDLREKFYLVKQRRMNLFEKAFTHISGQIDPIYKELTKSESMPIGGNAYLTQENPDEPYLQGIKYHAMPPTKRFRDMEHLSGGEKTVAALALLFAIHSYHPSPFFVLDEVDAALDNANVAKVANYIKTNSGPNFQFIVISLKISLFQHSDGLVGTYR